MKMRASDRRNTAYVSLNSGKSWHVIGPDGAVREQFRDPPADAATYVSQCEFSCCEHECHGE
jgi:hypothetical protein